MEESVQIHTYEYDNLPSSVEFASQIEPRNVPAVFVGCVKDWIAFSKWNPSNGGLDYLQKRVGSSTVEAMLSRSAPVFYGDLKSHERVPLPFSSFIGFCKLQLQGTDDGNGVCVESERQGVAESDSDKGGLLCVDSAQQIYLAQVPIVNIENEERVQLGTLRDDIQTPAMLGTNEISSINLWMNNARARSSSHYDPHNNLLCVVAGCKQVVLWPPSASPLLYPMPIYGEASNHSSVSLENPDFSIHPRAERLMEHSQKVILRAGDALFIPEGWFHQVDSDDLTIAVNFWWRSNVMSSMAEHMDAYYLRRILRRLTDKEMNKVLHKSSSAVMGKMQKESCELPNNGDEDYQNHDLDHKCGSKNLEGEKLKQRNMFHELEPITTQVLHELLSIVHDGVNAAEHSQPDQPTSTNESACSVKGALNKNEAANSFHLEDDPVATILWNLEPHILENVFLAMVVASQVLTKGLECAYMGLCNLGHLGVKFNELDLDLSLFWQLTAMGVLKSDMFVSLPVTGLGFPHPLDGDAPFINNKFPRSLEALILHLLSPVGAEVLTRKFDEMDQETNEENRNQFYQAFYGVFDDQFAVMDAILNRKELFALQAFKNVLDQYLGENFNGPKTSG